ncbi:MULTISPECIES: hypothetical protein [Rhizobium]|uniref:Uncharacterized protein n=1 Tax=Rhizobium rhododendri TaxID=2506430 RepID=A0ABY8IQ45_9HYPH|nr:MULTISPECIES: hypothetical protein [Rhizobium]WFS25160.1 hypothetical protein PR018_23090 [Rhizobium rhododendri]
MSSANAWSIGRERIGKLVAGIERESALLADPNDRADHFMRP